MSDGGRVRRARPSEEEADQRRDASPSAAATDADTEASSTDELIDEVDDLLDEIDEVLEANAEEFIRSYVQKGGE